MHRNPPKKMPKRETHWFERGAWGIWVWVWVWAKSRDKESSRRLSIKIMGERRKRRRKKEEKERMEAKKLRDWSREEKETHKYCWDRRVSESCDLELWCYDLYWAWFFVFNFFHLVKINKFFFNYYFTMLSTTLAFSISWVTLRT